MPSWRDLQADLRRLERESPPVLLSYPGTDSDEPTGRRCSIDLAAYAEDVAADLYARYKGLVDLRVGLLPYPGRRRSGRTRGGGRRQPSYFSASGRADCGKWGLSVGLLEPASPPRVSSGFAARVPLEITNRSEVDRHLQTNGVLETYVVDEALDVVAGYAGRRRTLRCGPGCLAASASAVEAPRSSPRRHPCPPRRPCRPGSPTA